MAPRCQKAESGEWIGRRVARESGTDACRQRGGCVQCSHECSPHPLIPMPSGAEGKAEHGCMRDSGMSETGVHTSRAACRVCRQRRVLCVAGY